GVEHLPRGFERRLGKVARTVDGVAQNGMAGRREVDPDLMCAPGLERDRDERRALEPLEHAVARDRAPAGLAAAGHPSPLRGPCRRERGGELARALRVPFDQRDVLAFDRVLAKEALESAQRLAVAGEDERSGRVAVETVVDADVRPAPVAMLEVE